MEVKVERLDDVPLLPALMKEMGLAEWPMVTYACGVQEREVRAFRSLNLTAVRMGERVLRHVSVLTDTQQRILRLLGLSERLYTGLAAQSYQPP